MFEENFPEWDRHPRWGEEPLLFLVIAQTLKQAEESLWRRIEGFLEPGSYTVNKVGGIINKVTHKKNGNVILFFSHDNPNEARKRIQSFTAHFAWVDELPGNVKLIEEVQRRVQARSGQMLMTFTPKAPTPDIKRYVEQLQEPYGQRYVLKALDNPAYTKEDKKKLMESLKSFSDKYKATILEGAWVQPEEMVYEFDYDTMVEAPPNYSPSWRHVESSDPALSSAHGLIVAAEEPNSGVWYIIRADYLREMLVPEKLIAEVVSRTGGVNLVRRIADPHEVWYIQTAATKGLQYVSPYKKNERKHELIKNLQAALGHRVKIAPWCQSLIDEIQTCHWSETAENKIAKGSRFHLLDAAQYAVDCLPKYEAGQVPQPWYAELRIANQKRKEQKAAALKRPPRPYRVIRRRRR
jgi:phage terminase large subunit-like protein